MTEVLFYHLEQQPIERVLPGLLERTLERGWRAVVQCGSQERLDALDASLWTYRDDSFLPHGTAGDGPGTTQPIYLTAGEDNPNGARVRFLVEGATVADAQGYERVVHLFDGHDAVAVEQARAEWKRARSAGFEVTYWQQADNGRWEKRA
ncbi:MAG: DNA polymerase III subunit chi [Hyphomicrobiaceae bacterium]|nr:DNA polymerase III subunit chi [Hyphomicrobiaceae bacterium]